MKVLPHCTMNVGSVPSHIIAAEIFSGEMKRVIAQWKFRHRTSETKRLARIAVRALRIEGSAGAVGVVTWAPTSDRRRRQRGYDQAEILARAVANSLRLPCRRLLVRVGNTAQTGRGRSDRLVDGPKFRARPPRGIARGVLVVDDVVTTGSTLRSAEAALRRAGHSQVVLLALARTPGESLL